MLTAFVVLNVLAAAFAVDRGQAFVGEQFQFQGLVVTLAYVVFFVGAWATVRSERRRTILIGCVAVGAAIVAAYAVIQRAGLDPIWSTLNDDRVFSTIGQSNSLAAYLVLSMPLVAALCVRRHWPWAVAVAGVLALSLAAVAFTLSRGGFLGLAAAWTTFVTALWFGRHEPILSRRGVVVVSILAAGIAAAVVASPGVRAVAERVMTRALQTADLREGSVRMHLDQWAVGAAIVADHPLLGTGQDTYVLMFEGYRDDVLPADRAVLLSFFRPESPHNVYLAIAAGAGVPALLAYLTVVGAAATSAISATHSAPDPRATVFAAACLAAVAGHLVTDMFLTAETSGSVSFWIVLGAAAALRRVRPDPALGGVLNPELARPVGVPTEEIPQHNQSSARRRAGDDPVVMA